MDKKCRECEVTLRTSGLCRECARDYQRELATRKRRADPKSNRLRSAKDYNRRGRARRQAKREVLQLPPGQALVYFIGKRGTDHIKIGLSMAIPRTRLATIQIGNPRELYLIGWVRLDVETARRFERKLHTALSERNVRGEWFNIGESRALEYCNAPPFELMCYP